MALPAEAVSPGNSICNLAKAPAVTLNVLLVPVDPAVAVIVWLVAWVTVTAWLLSTPAVNEPEVVGEINPFAALVVKATVEAKLVTVLLLASLAVIFILNAVPAV